MASCTIVRVSKHDISLPKPFLCSVPALERSNSGPRMFSRAPAAHTWACSCTAHVVYLAVNSTFDTSCKLNYHRSGKVLCTKLEVIGSTNQYASGMLMFVTNDITCKSGDDSKSARGQTTSISLTIIRLATSLDTFCNAPAAEPQTVQSDDLQ